MNLLHQRWAEPRDPFWELAAEPITREDIERFTEQARKENDLPLLRESFEQFVADVLADFKPSENPDANS